MLKIINIIKGGWGQLYNYIFVVFVWKKKTVQGKSFKFHYVCNYNTVKIFAIAMGNVFSMYQTSEQELKRQVKDLVVALQLEG